MPLWAKVITIAALAGLAAGLPFGDPLPEWLTVFLLIAAAVVAKAPAR